MPKPLLGALCFLVALASLVQLFLERWRLGAPGNDRGTRQDWSVLYAGGAIVFAVLGILVLAG